MRTRSYFAAGVMICGLSLLGCTQDWDRKDVSNAYAVAAPASTVASPAGGASHPLDTGGGLVPLASRPSFADAPDHGSLMAYPTSPVVRRHGAYTWHRVDISEQHALRSIFQGELNITTPRGERLAFEYQRHVEHASGDWTWIGRLKDAGNGYQAILTFGADAVFGTFDQQSLPPLRLAVKDGQGWLVETDPRVLAGAGNRGARRNGPDYLVPPAVIPGAMTGAQATGPQAAESDSPSTAEMTTSSDSASSDETVVDVLVGYTTGFAAAQGGTSQALTRINFLVDVANQAYLNSQVATRIRLVHAVAVDYPDATDNGDALEKLTGYDTSKSGSARYVTPDPVFDELRDSRETYGADLVVLVRAFNDPENDGCGIAWLIGGGQTEITQAYEYFGYSVVSDGQDVGDDGKTYFCRDETFVHELGHNMGSAHDVETAKGDDGVLDSDDYGRYPHSFGYRSTASTGDFYTVMAYREKRESGPQQVPYRVFSNPRVTYCGGFACGTSAADNAQSLGQTSPIISAFRATKVADQPMARTRTDVNGDGNGDLIWFNAMFQRVGYWAMSGNSIIHHGGQPAGGDYVAITTGDYNGDGKADIVWRGPQNDLQFWMSNGSTFDWMPFLDDTGLAGNPEVYYPVGWTLVGSKDVDADGRDDLLWFNSGSQQVAYWVMAGNKISRHGGQSAGGNYSIISTGDYNGDGRVDLTWVGPQGDLQLWFSNGASFDWQPFTDSTGLAGSPYVYYPGGWSLIASRDMDADGRSDLIWFNAASQRVAYWIMAGNSISRHGGQASGGGYGILHVGDFNGDRRADIVWRGPGDDLQLWFSNGTTFDWQPFTDSTGLAGSPYVYYPTGWSLIRSP